MSLLAWYPLISDLSNNGVGTVTTSGTPTFSSGGKLGNCMTGNDISFTVSSLANSKVWSICFWGYAVSSQITGNWTLLVRVRDNGSHFRFEACPSSYGSGVYCYSTHNNASYAICTGGMTAPTGGFYDQWCHVCVTSDGTTISGYYNGKLRSTWGYTGTGAITGIFDLTNNAKCKKNDLRIYDHCLSAKEVEIISRGLVVHYPLNGGDRGQANLYDFQSIASKWVADYVTLSDYVDPEYGNVLKVTTPSSLSGNHRIYRNVSNVWTSGNKYTVSFLSKASKSVSCDMSRSVGNFSPTFTLDTVWRRYSGIITCTETASGGTLSFRVNTTEADVYITQIKLESGEVCTPYIPGTSDPTYTALGYDVATEYDTSGNGYDATKVGTLDYSANTARYLTSSGFNSSAYNYVDIVPTGFTNTYSFAWWARNTAQGMFWGFSNGNRLNLYMADNVYYWNTGDGSNNPFNLSSTTYRDNNWHHYVVTGDGTTVKLYIDGEQKATAKTFKGITGTRLFFNGWDTSSSYDFNGYLSDFRLYSTTLTAEQVLDLYKSCGSVSDTGRLLTYELVESY